MLDSSVTFCASTRKLAALALSDGAVVPSVAAAIIAEGAASLNATRAARAAVEVCDFALDEFDAAVADETKAD